MPDEWEDREYDLDGVGDDEKEIEIDSALAPDEGLTPAGENPSRLPWVLWGLGVAGIAVALYLYFFPRVGPAPEASPPVAASNEPAASSRPPEPEEPKEDVPAIEIPALDASDGLFREQVAALSRHPLLASLLVSDDLVRKLVVVVANVSNGESPARQLSHLRPEARFTVLPAPGGRTVIDPASYRRYDGFAELFGSLDDAGVAKLYRLFRPLLEQAHAELGLADRRDFEDTLGRAAAVLLQTPVVDGPIEVRGVSVNYTFEDPALERLSPPQKQLLRMGPDNTRRIQQKIRDLLGAIGIDAPPSRGTPGP